jgi:hypothetical protein
LNPKPPMFCGKCAALNMARLQPNTIVPIEVRLKARHRSVKLMRAIRDRLRDPSAAARRLFRRVSMIACRRETR